MKVLDSTVHLNVTKMISIIIEIIKIGGKSWVKEGVHWENPFELTF